MAHFFLGHPIMTCVQAKCSYASHCCQYFIAAFEFMLPCCAINLETVNKLISSHLNLNFVCLYHILDSFEHVLRLVKYKIVLMLIIVFCKLLAVAKLKKHECQVLQNTKYKHYLNDLFVFCFVSFIKKFNSIRFYSILLYQQKRFDYC